MDNDKSLDTGTQSASKGAELIMYGGQNCGVCQVVWPKLQQQLSTRWPDLTLRYIDCEKDPQACAQSQVFSLPVVRLFFDGQLFLEKIQVFSLGRFIEEIDHLCHQYY